jgi:PadR family transcriptional regulator AphA
MSLRYVILTALSEQDLTGYQITKEFDLVLGNLWSASHQQVYRELAKLADEGLASFEMEAQTGKPDRKVYSLTASGKDALTNWIEEPVALAPTRNALLVKLYAGASRNTLLEHVTRFKSSCRAALAEYRWLADRYYPEALEDMENWKKRAFLTLRYGITQREAQVAWAEEAEQVIGDMEPSDGGLADDDRARDQAKADQ